MAPDSFEGSVGANSDGSPKPGIELSCVRSGFLRLIDRKLSVKFCEIFPVLSIAADPILIPNFEVLTFV